MTVNNLENQEQGVNLQTREAQQRANDEKNAAKAKGAIDRTKKGAPSAEDELEAFRQRIAEAKKLTDGRPERNGRLSDFERGRDAAIKAIEG